MDYKEITDLIRLLGKTNIADLTIEKGDFRIRLRTAEGMPGQPVTMQPQVFSATPGSTSASPPPPAHEAQAAPKAQVPPAPAEALTDYVTIKSPMVGTLYRRPSPDKDLFVKVGDKISPGTVLCVIEAMKLFNEIESELSGTIVKIFAEDSSPVEYEQPLFLIDPKG